MLYLMMIDSAVDKRKFVVIYETYRCFMMKIAFDVLKDDHMAEDAVHEAFIKVAENMDRIEETESLRTKRYLATIVKNTAIDIYRKRKRTFGREISADDPDIYNGAVTYMETDVDNEILDILKNLPEIYRDVFLLKYSSCLDNREISRILGISEGTIRQRIARGKELIQKALEGAEVIS